MARSERLSLLAHFDSLNAFLHGEIDGWPLAQFLSAEDPTLVDLMRDELEPHLQSDGSIAFEVEAHLVLGRRALESDRSVL